MVLQYRTIIVVEGIAMYTLGPNEKTSTVMFYSQNAFVRGDTRCQRECARQYLAADAGCAELPSFVEGAARAFRRNAAQIHRVQ